MNRLKLFIQKSLNKNPQSGLMFERRMSVCVPRVRPQSVHDKVFQPGIKEIYKKVKRRQFQEQVMRDQQFFGEYEPFYLESKWRHSSV